MITLAVSKPLPNFTRWEVDDWEPNEKRGYGRATVILRSAGPTNYTITRELFIRNAGVGSGRSDKIGYLAPVGGAIADQLVWTPDAVALPTGFTDAHAAYQGAVGNRLARLDALALWMLANSVADSSLASA
jgi:hypothetical protein